MGDREKNAVRQRWVLPGGLLFWCIIGAMLAYSWLVLWVDNHYFPAAKLMQVDAAMYTSAIIGLLLAFRTNSAYERWWEGRRLWGQLLNEIRNLCLKATTLVTLDGSERQELTGVLSTFPLALRDHLRGKAFDLVDLGLVPEQSRVEHAPAYLAHRLYACLACWRDKGSIDGFDRMMFDVHARSLMDICGGCERILRSPIAGSYKLLIWHGLGLYLLTLPWLLVPIIHEWAVLVAVIGSYFVIALELLAEEVEEPFGTQANDLPLDSISEVVRGSVAYLLGSEEIAGPRTAGGNEPGLKRLPD